MTSNGKRPLPVGGDYILGLDVGANSVGWAVVDAVPEGDSWQPVGLRAAGSRIFPVGKENFNTKKEQSKAATRRTARSMRRRLRRHVRRMHALYALLAANGMLPDIGPLEGQTEPYAVRISGALQGHDGLDARLVQQAMRYALPDHVAERILNGGGLKRARHDIPHEWVEVAEALPHTWIYVLRKQGLSNQLSLEEIGRCLYHICERRGFKSNRKVNKPEKSEGPTSVGNEADASTSEKKPRKRGGKKHVDGQEDTKENRARLGTLKQIRELRALLGERTLGEHFAEFRPIRFDPDREGDIMQRPRIRQRFTAREMYEKEFDLLWQQQQRFYPDVLTEDLRKQVWKAIFYQLPLRSAHHLIGFCELEPKLRRTQRGTLEYQEFRMLQRLNDVRVVLTSWESRQLTADERLQLLRALEEPGRKALTKTEACELLGLPRPRKGTYPSINFGQNRDSKQDQENKALLGNHTANLLRTIFDGQRGPAWDDLDREHQRAVVQCVLDEVPDETLIQIGLDQWGLNQEAAEEYGNLNLDDQYGRFSFEALQKLLPHLWQGTSLSSAIKQEYPKAGRVQLPQFPLLPPLVLPKPPQRSKHPELREEWMRSLAQRYTGYVGIELRNPVVQRALTQLRKVVNALIREYGLPAEIHLEYARDLKKPKLERLQIQDRIEAKHKEREDAAKKLLHEHGIGPLDPAMPRDRKLIDRWLLAMDCDFTCPYTGKRASARQVISGEFHEDHIIPRSRWPNNEWRNITFCHGEANARKGNKTPYEAFHPDCGGDPAHWAAIEQRVHSWAERLAEGGRKEAMRRKIKLFLARPYEVESITEGWMNQQLQDTRYAGRVARRYLGLLYGCLGDTGNVPIPNNPEHSRNVIKVVQGGVTSQVRKALGLLELLGGSRAEGEEADKSRDDHRHHAVDAMAIAVTSQSIITAINKLNARRPLAGKTNEYELLLEELKAMLPQFDVEQFRAKARVVFKSINVSHRPLRRVYGALHHGTNLSLRDSKGRRPRSAEEAKDTDRFCYVVKRVPVHRLTPNSFARILNGGSRRAILAQLERMGYGNPQSHPGFASALKKLKGANLPVTPPWDAKTPGRRTPIRSVAILESAPSAVPVGQKSYRQRYAKTGSNHHIKVFEYTTGPKKGQWHGMVLTMMEAEALRNGSGKGQNQRAELFWEGKPDCWPAGSRLVCELAKGDIVAMGPEDTPEYFVLRSISGSESSLDLEFSPLSDASSDLKARRTAGLRIKSWGKLKLQCVCRVQVNPDGSIRGPKERSAHA